MFSDLLIFPATQIQRVGVAASNKFLDCNGFCSRHSLGNVNNVARFIAALQEQHAGITLKSRSI